ncbi:lycopene beta-cyclase CrtY [Altericroceibacterium xinjiangense]|uniref:lycopene beta-cyclase CrtY n=1 Tax=Altericroceibacterium xinjiangense TaxID=762261 RepID=UPI000F7E2FF8|nr:lycopene beta-cyclase CrtY [Altericroceibacterium xinjiangense]
MGESRCDIAIVGGGLSGGLIAAALARHRPELTVRLIEAGQQLGGNHRWSWFSTDLDAVGTQLMQLFPHVSWEGHEVRFPGFERRLETGYRSLVSPDFDGALRDLLPAEALVCGRSVITLDADGVTLGDGHRIAAGAVIDCRGLGPSAHLTGGWQVFYGRHVRTRAPHGVERPVIMDAMVRQHGTYRFIYALPLAPDELFIEDTYYADDPTLDEPELKARVDRYCARHGCQGETIHEETGILPVITGGDFERFEAEQRIDGVARAGAGAGLVHPLTSYTLPLAVRTAIGIASLDDVSGPALSDYLARNARSHWHQTRFYRMLGTMLFAAAPEERYRVFAHFYRLPEPVIQRFYAAQSTGLDKARILIGKPPLPVHRALLALAGRAAA